MSAATILVVEDNEKNLKLVRDVLQYAGFDVVAASSASRVSRWPSSVRRTWS